MELLKHELYKIFTRKSIYFAIAILLVLYSIPLVQFEIIEQRENAKEEAQIYKEWEGPVTKEKLEFAKQATAEENLVEDKSGGFRRADQSLYRVGTEFISSNVRLMNWNERMANLQAEITQLETENSGGYEYKEKVMAYEAFQKVGPPEIYYNKGWANVVDFVKTYGLIFMGALILLGVSPVFSDEYSNGTDNFILTSKKGKSSLITAKIQASVIYILILVIFFALINLFVTGYRFGLAGWDTPIRNLYQYSLTPYALDLWQYYTIQLGIHAAAAMAFGLLVLLISALSRSALIPFFTGGVFFSVPILLTSIFSVEIPWVLKMVEFSYTGLMKVTGFFTEFKVFNIAGFPVLYLNFALVLFTIVSFITLYLIYYSFRNHQIS